MAHRKGVTYEWNKGSRNGNAKINEDKVIEIKTLLAVRKSERLKHEEIAEKTGVSKSTVRQISAGLTWKEVKLKPN